jgi:phage-related minor tail protein
MISENKLSTNYRSIALLVIGSLVGICSLFLVPNKLSGYNQGAVAHINSAIIRKDEYQRAIALFRGDKRGSITDADLNLVLEKLIEEELLVQAALRSDSPRKDMKIRQRVLQTLLTSIQTRSAAGIGDPSQPAGEDLKFYLNQLRDNADIQMLKKVADNILVTSEID